VGVPRSLVQKVSDNELGVTAASLKDLTEQQILEIQDLKKKGSSNAQMAVTYDVSAKTIARALLVKISQHKNNVTVISPVEGLNDQGEFDTSNDISPGGFVRNGDDTFYVGAFLEDRKQYLLVKKTETGRYKIGLAVHSQLQVTDADIKTGFLESEIPGVCELVEILVKGGQSPAQGYEFDVYVDNAPYPLKGKLNAKGMIGYYDALTNMSPRINRHLVEIDITPQVQKEVSEETNTTKSALKGVTLDDFLAKHQILILPDQVVIVQKGKARTITSDHDFFDSIVEAIKAQDIDRAFELMEPRTAIEKYSAGRLNLDAGKVIWDGFDVTGTSLAKRLIAISKLGKPGLMDRFSKFMDKVFQNPSAALVQSGRIYSFMEYADIEVDEDGDLIVYKSVRGNYMDKHSGTISNKPGTIVRMARSFVNDNNASLCSYGLHVCSLVYLKQCFGDLGQRVVRCKLNPKDIVSITNDYNSSKIRCCEYLVVDDYTAEYNRQYKSIDMTGFYK